METLADRVKEARKHAGLTQIQLADKLGVSKNYITQIETGRKKPSIKTIDEIAEITKTHTINLLKGDEFIENISKIASKNDVEALKRELNALITDL